MSSGGVWGQVKRSSVSHQLQQPGKEAVLQRSKVSKQFAVFLQNSSRAESELHGPSCWVYLVPSKGGTVSAVSEEFHS